MHFLLVYLKKKKKQTTKVPHTTINHKNKHIKNRILCRIFLPHERHDRQSTNLSRDSINYLIRISISVEFTPKHITFNRLTEQDCTKTQTLRPLLSGTGWTTSLGSAQCQRLRLDTQGRLGATTREERHHGKSCWDQDPHVFCPAVCSYKTLKFLLCFSLQSFACASLEMAPKTTGLQALLGHQCHQNYNCLPSLLGLAWLLLLLPCLFTILSGLLMH